MERDPRVLPCQHTFCFECLKNGIEERGLFYLICPTCFEKYDCLDGANSFPKSIIKHSISISLDDRIKCDKHNQESFQPLLVCLTCKISNLCGDCINNDHSGENCKIFSKEKLFIQTQTNRQKIYEKIENYRNILLSDICQLNIKLTSLETSYLNMINDMMTKSLSMMDEFEKQIDTEYKDIKDIFQDIFIEDEEPFLNYLLRSVKQITLEDEPKIDINLNIYEEENIHSEEKKSFFMKFFELFKNFHK